MTGHGRTPRPKKNQNLTVENKNSHGDSACRGMAPKRASKQKQQLNVDQFELAMPPELAVVEVLAVSPNSAMMINGFFS